MNKCEFCDGYKEWWRATCNKARCHFINLEVARINIQGKDKEIIRLSNSQRVKTNFNKKRLLRTREIANE